MCVSVFITFIVEKVLSTELFVKGRLKSSLLIRRILGHFLASAALDSAPAAIPEALQVGRFLGEVPAEDVYALVERCSWWGTE